MKPIRWTEHALRNLADRDIDHAEADRTIAQPEFAVPDLLECEIHMRRYFDKVLGQIMLLRVIVESTPREIIVITLYKTSQIERYLRGL